jgi:ADP-ribose pyrophosphatase
MKPRAKIVSSRTIYKGPVFSVRQDRVIEPGGVRVRRDIVVHSGSVVIMPIFPDGRILLVHQYRHSLGRYLWELTAGRIDPGESPLAAAKRELLEETGYSAKRYDKLLDVFPTPGFVNEHMVIFAATKLVPGKARPEEDERITARRFTLQALERWIRTGKIRDAKSITGILYYARFFAKQ